MYFDCKRFWNVTAKHFTDAQVNENASCFCPSCRIHEGAFVLVVKFMNGLLSAMSVLGKGAFVCRGFCLYPQFEHMKMFISYMLNTDSSPSGHFSVRCMSRPDNSPIDSPPSCPGLHDLRVASLNTYYNIKTISLHYNITDQLSD